MKARAPQPTQEDWHWRSVVLLYVAGFCSSLSTPGMSPKTELGSSNHKRQRPTQGQVCVPHCTAHTASQVLCSKGQEVLSNNQVTSQLWIFLLPPPHLSIIYSIFKIVVKYAILSISNSLASSIFTLLYNHDHCPFLNMVIISN